LFLSILERTEVVGKLRIVERKVVQKSGTKNEPYENQERS